MGTASRADRLVPLGILVLGIVVLWVAVAALQSPTSSQAAPPTVTHTRTVSPSAPVSRPTSSVLSSSAPPSSSASHAPAAPVTATPIVIMNNTTTTGLAAQAESKFQAAGWTVTSIGTMSNNILSTAAYYDAAVPGAHRAALALQRQFPTIKRVVPRFAELAPGPVVVVLAWDYSAS
ncbi:MAG: LytR C-terminal domain-containing protein [Jatrophihabitans sp.]|uniref:LytR C-terminal domain-containing protein n=1 Tax=Jatrophihabitans sp. TaxID=1932789 RepID=UPI003F7D5ABF